MFTVSIVDAFMTIECQSMSKCVDGNDLILGSIVDCRLDFGFRLLNVIGKGRHKKQRQNGVFVSKLLYNIAIARASLRDTSIRHHTCEKKKDMVSFTHFVRLRS